MFIDVQACSLAACLMSMVIECGVALGEGPRTMNRAVLSVSSASFLCGSGVRDGIDTLLGESHGFHFGSLKVIVEDGA